MNHPSSIRTEPICKISRSKHRGLSTVNYIGTCCQCDLSASEDLPLAEYVAMVNFGVRKSKWREVFFHAHLSCMQKVWNADYEELDHTR